MSAIWGKLSYQKAIRIEEIQTLESPFKRKCKLDRICSVSHDQVSFSCGVQQITPESINEVLPIEDDNCLFTADCIIDNREELISLLRAESVDIPDGRLFYLCYRAWGLECFKKVEGLFSVAVLDKATSSLILAVDKMSYRCLYYHADSDRVIFSTLLEPIVTSVKDAKINDYYMKDFLTAFGMLPNLIEGETPYQDIFQVKAGTYITINSGNVSETEYWNPSMSECKWTFRNADVVAREFRSVYEHCLQKAIRTYGEVGSALSSGFDSASASSIAADLLHFQNKKLYTYTYVPSDEFDNDSSGSMKPSKNIVVNEKEDVLKIAAMHPNMEPSFLCNGGKNCLDNLSEIQDILEIPFKAFVNMPNLNEIYGKAASKGCKVVLLGQCGNSTVSFGLIDHVLYDLYANKHYLKAALWLSHYSKTIGESRKEAFKTCLQMYKATYEEYRDDKFVYELYNSNLSENILENYPLEQRYRQSKKINMYSLPIDRIHYRENLYSKSMFAYLGAIETKLGLYNGIVLRDPTKDSEMISFCYHLPFKYFAYKGKTRWLIREACSNLLPPHILDNYLRYSVQNNDWMLRVIRDKASILPIIEAVLNQCSYSDYYSKEEIEQLLTNMGFSDEWDENSFMKIMYLFMEAFFEIYQKNLISIEVRSII